ncbi:hypothetical protein EXIGLDRAFT_8627 [Exidia glandulosa HHB12029]|uniref:Ubiquitin-like-conjugating enzyme ATG10 n=1 Tax=Exidia glandulosa HHB12029 TaxID=1314781 RepID=A0A165QQ53_EXIGL|nr:hypothetical protein EXIGLDRAFT_8627 [Exidia glandulosa HHB12029]
MPLLLQNSNHLTSIGNLRCMSSSHLTRDEFAAACNAFLQRPISNDETSALRGHLGWTLLTSPTVPSLRCLARTVNVRVRREDYAELEEASFNDLDVEEEDIDDATAAPIPDQTQTLVTVQQYIAYSPTFAVPVFYFSSHDANGAPTSLEAILRTNLFKQHVTRSVARTAHSLSLPGEDADAPFPLLSQGDHPVLGRPCWFLHPCGIPTALAELMEESDMSAHSAVWIDTWLSLISTVIDLRT